MQSLIDEFATLSSRLSTETDVPALQRKNSSRGGWRYNLHCKIGLQAMISVSSTLKNYGWNITFRDGSLASALASSTNVSNSSSGILTVVVSDEYVGLWEQNIPL